MKPEEFDTEKKKFVAAVLKHAKPIDFADLEGRGVISKAGAWYRVHDWAALPEHAICKIYEVEQGPKGLKVKFTSASKTERFAKKMEKMGFITTKK